jgi:hypothetical protein
VISKDKPFGSYFLAYDMQSKIPLQLISRQTKINSSKKQRMSLVTELATANEISKFDVVF